MIRFLPKMETIQLSLKEEEVFTAMDEMLLSLHERLQKVSAYLGAKEPFRLEDIVIGHEAKDDPMTGLVNARTVSIRRMIGHAYEEPMLIGHCGE